MSEPVPPSKSVQCPACRSLDVRLSYRKGIVDAIMARNSRLPLRCRRCSYRFYRKLQPGEVLGLPEPAIPVDAGRPDSAG